MSNGITKRNENVLFENMLCETEQDIHNKEACVEFVNSMPHCKNMFLVGKPGTGKTHTASAIINELDKRNVTGAIRTVRQIVRQFDKARDFSSQLSESRVLNSLVSVDVLIIDEVCLGKGNDQEKFILHDIIDGRYGEMKPTILISNESAAGIGENIGQRLVSRLKTDLTQLIFTGRDKRQ